MRWLFVSSLAAALTVTCFAQNTGKPDFSGNWTMDRDRSFGLAPNMQVTMVVEQADNKITLQTHFTSPQGENKFRDDYVIDGQEREFTPQSPTGPVPGSKGKRKVNWLPNYRGIVVEEETTTETPKGPANGHMTRKWIISNNGELIVDLYVDNQQVSYEMKRTFVKK